METWLVLKLVVVVLSIIGFLAYRHQQLGISRIITGSMSPTPQPGELRSTYLRRVSAFSGFWLLLLEEDISEKSMLDSDARILIETVASQLGECHLNAMSAFGPKFHDQAIRILARGDEPRELTRLVIDNMEKGPPADAMLLDYKERLDNCTLRVNLEHDVNYF